MGTTRIWCGKVRAQHGTQAGATRPTSRSETEDIQSVPDASVRAGAALLPAEVTKYARNNPHGQLGKSFLHTLRPKTLPRDEFVIITTFGYPTWLRTSLHAQPNGNACSLRRMYLNRHYWHLTARCACGKYCSRHRKTAECGRAHESRANSRNARPQTVGI